MTATPKQVRAAIRRIEYHVRHLQAALNQAHRKDVLVYQNYKTESPCACLYELEKRLEKTTEKSLARAMREEINKTIKHPQY